MKKIFLLVFISLFFLSIQSFGQMPASPQLLQKIKNGNVKTPFVLQNIETLRKNKVDAPWVSDKLKSLKMQSPLKFARSFGSEKTPSGQWHALAILVQFSDKAFQTDPISFDNLLFSSERGTLKDYYSKVSYGNLDIVTVNLPSTLGWSTAPETYAYYCNGQNGLGDYPQNSQKLVEDVVSIVDPQVDFSQYDNDGDGLIDALFIIHTGPGAELTGSNDDIWSHAWQIYPKLVDGVYVFNYSVEPEYWLTPGDMTVGVYAHELGHAAFGLPDLYDYDGSSNGLGSWSLMASGSWNGYLGSSPSYPDAFCHIQMGYIFPTIVTGERLNQPINYVEDNAEAFILWTNGVYTNEYFLVENRNKVGYDTTLASTGLNIYHVDENVWSGNDYEWYPGYTNYGHYLVAMEQADGAYQLEKGISYGDAGDPFPGINSNYNFNANTAPNSKNYSSNNTFVSVNNISDPDFVMYADLNTTPNYDFPEPRNLKATAGNGEVYLEWDAPTQPGQMELGYDDGSAESFFYVNTPTSESQMFAVGFTHSIPYTINEGKFFLRNEISSLQSINVYVVGDAGGYPDMNNILAIGYANLPAAATSGEWIDVDFPDVSLPANAVFYLVCQWNNSTVTEFTVGSDESSPDYMSWWTQDNGSYWNYWGYTDWMFRAVITSGLTSQFVVKETISPIKNNANKLAQLSSKKLIKSVTEKPLIHPDISNSLAYKTFMDAVKMGVKAEKLPTFTNPVLSSTVNYYDIYRSLTSGSGYQHIQTTTALNTYDYNVTNSTMYYYVVTAVYENPSGTSIYSNEVEAFPKDPAILELNSPFTYKIPNIDGIINVNEWDDATLQDITTLGVQPVTVYVKNTGSKLYIAISDKSHNLYSWDQIGIYFDENHDKLWSENTGEEGNFWLMWDPSYNFNYGGAHLQYRSIYGNPARTDFVIDNPQGVIGAISQDPLGGVQYEMEIDLVNSPLNSSAGQTIGAYIWAYSGYDGIFVGEFPYPLNENWANPAFYGNLNLGTTSNTPTIEIDKESLDHYIAGDTLITDKFKIWNSGNLNLEFNISDLLLSPNINMSNTLVSITSKKDGKNDFDEYISKLTSGKSQNVSWLDESPLNGNLAPGDTAEITVLFNSTGLPFGNYTAEIIINSNDVNNPAKYVTANLVKSVPNVTTDDNEDNQLSGNPDYDMDVYLFNGDYGTPIEFNIFIKENSITSSQLSILAWDVDWAASGWNGERDKVWLNGNFLGYLTGANGEWSTTVLNVDPSIINPGPNGKNLVKVEIDEFNEGWAVQVDWGQLIINGSSGTAYIRYVDLDKQNYLPGEYVTITEEIDANPTMNVRVETNIIDEQMQILAGSSYYIDATEGNEPQQFSLQIPNGVTNGNYKVMVIVYDAATLIQQDIEFVDFTVSDQPVLVGQTIFSGLATINSSVAPAGYYIYTYLKNSNWQVVAIDTVFPNTLGKNYAVSILEGAAGVKDGDTLVFTIVGPYLYNQWFEKYCFECKSAIFRASFTPEIVEYDINTADERNMSIPIVPGYNAVSWNVKPVNDSTHAVFNDLISTGKVQIILDYLNDGYQMFFNYYIPELTKYNPMRITTPLKGYFVKLKAGSLPDALNIYGMPICNEAPIPLNVGYNLVSYLPEISADIPSALQSLSTSNINTVLSYNNDGYGNEWFDAYPQGNLYTMTDGKGYFIRLSDYPETLIYPEFFNTLISPPFAQSNNKDAKIMKVNEVGELPMIIVAYGTEVTYNGVLVPVNSILTAVDKDGIVCGEGIFVADGIVSLAIRADDPSTEVDEGADIGEYVSLQLNGQLVHSKILWKEFGDTPKLDNLDTITDILDSEIPTAYALNNNFPNPFNPSTTISYDLPQKSRVSIIIYDINGQIVKNLVRTEQNAGKYKLSWDGTSDLGNTVSTGIYFLRIVAGDFTKVQKMMMLK